MFNQDRKKIKLWEIAEIVNGWTPSTKVFDYWDWDISRIWPNDMSKRKDYKYITGWERYISKKWLDHSSAKLVPEWTVILSSRAPIGYVNITRNKISTNQWCKSIICWEKLNNEFLYYFLTINKQLLENNSSWATFKELSSDSLKRIELFLPPLPTQQRIASILSKYDDLIENNNQRIKILEQEAELIYKEWFVKFKFPWHEKIKMIDSWTEFGIIPDWWEVRKVEELIEKIPTGKKYDNKTTTPIWKVPVIDQWSSWIIWYHDDEPWVVASTENPIITFANHTCYQNIIMFPFSTIQNIFAYYPNSVVKSDIYRLHFHTNKLVKISAYKWHFPDYLSKKVLYPGSELPKQYWKIVEPIMIEKYYLQKQNENLRTTRDILLPKLISGEVEV